MVKKVIFERLFNAISRDPITFNKLCRTSKLHKKTVREYLNTIEWIQGQEKIDIERKDFRLLIRRSKKMV